MQFTALKINQPSNSLEEKDYDKAVSYIEFLDNARKEEKIQKEKSAENKVDVEAVVDSLVGAIPNMGKTLEEYRSERLKNEIVTRNPGDGGSR